MITFLHRWRTMLLCLPAALVLGGVYWVCLSVVHGLGVIMSDGTQLEYDHDLPRGYEGKTMSKLASLQAVTVSYAQNHKGYLPFMQNSKCGTERFEALFSAPSDKVFSKPGDTTSIHAERGSFRFKDWSIGQECGFVL